MTDVVRRLRAYRMIDDEGNEDVHEPVTPAPISSYRMVAMSETEAEVLDYLGRGLVKLGAERTGLLCIRLAASWRAGE